MFQNINWEIILPLLIIQALLTLIALIDLMKAKGTRGPKIMWVLIIICISTIGPIIYFLTGRRD